MGKNISDVHFCTFVVLMKGPFIFQDEMAELKEEKAAEPGIAHFKPGWG